MSKFYLTTPIYYVNASPHIGHAYTSIICDSVARYRRLKGDDVFFLTGTDEHGEKIKEAALASNQDVQQFVDSVSENFKRLWEAFSIRYDGFIRTTDAEHKEIVREFIQKLHVKGDIYKGSYRSLYCMPCETLFTESQLDGATVCPVCKRALEVIEEENYFFRLSKYADWFKEFIKSNPDWVRPAVRYNEVIGFIENNALEDLCISRPKSRVSWGIDFPLDDAFVVYVWFDALINYVSSLGCFHDTEKFTRWWPADVHYIGKDILRHHAIFWPIMLKALDIELPRCIFAHGWWMQGEEKMSKSLGNIVNPFTLLDELTPLLGGNRQSAIDAVRYFLLREVPVGSDGNFSLSALCGRINSDLANDLGNLLYRTLNMAEKYFDSNISVDLPTCPDSFAAAFGRLSVSYIQSMDKGAFSEALIDIFSVIGIMNKYIEEVKPWTLAKEKKTDELASFLWSLLEGIRIAAIYLYPVMPLTAGSIMRQLGLICDDCSLQEASWGRQRSFSIQKEGPLFPRIDVN